MRKSRVRHSATLLNDGKVLVVGGKNDANAHNSAELYDPETGTWLHASSMKYSRTSHEASLLQDGRVLVSGGWSVVVAGRTLLSPTLNSAEVFDFEASH